MDPGSSPITRQIERELHYRSANSLPCALTPAAPQLARL